MHRRKSQKILRIFIFNQNIEKYRTHRKHYVLVKDQNNSTNETNCLLCRRDAVDNGSIELIKNNCYMH